MSTVAVIFNEGKINKKGEVPIWLRIIKDRKSKYIALGVRVHKDNWDPDKCKVRKNHPNSQRLNNYIAKRVADAEGVALDLETNSRYSSPRKLKDAILGRTSESFIKYAEKNIQVLKNNEKIGTLAKYDSVLTKLKVYLKGQDLTFDEITVSFLKDYESYLKNKLSNSINTVHSNLKVLRKLVNDAVREEIFPLEKNPFLRFKLHTEKTKKNFLTDEELKVLEDLPLNTSLKSHHHRNMYVFAAYTGGLRISDVLQLKWENYDGERIILHTQKTDDTLSIIVPNKARVILDSYKTSDTKSQDFIFPFLKNYIDYSKPEVLFKAISSATAYTNKDLEALRLKCGIEKKLHFHTSRHTFAVRALRKGMRIEYVSKLMAHADIKTTQIYAKIVNEDLDKAMQVFND